MKITFESEDYPKKTIEIKGKRNEVMSMLYKYSAILNINPNEYEEVKRYLDYASLNYNRVSSSLQEMSIKEQLKYYIDKHIPYHPDRDKVLELIDKL